MRIDLLENDCVCSYHRLSQSLRLGLSWPVWRFPPAKVGQNERQPPSISSIPS
ncbi:hypothetical protein M5D96_002714 [Drosophila gunungcola]|uniref:Uncharacterized protein n=1 Tax=Drosophila gunungcola TaxID=103775 RepID=A0A9Q0BWP6_9MUSC|nr:hypothetical protein M5D96_002714 [Drosophila gunungcola]